MLIRILISILLWMQLTSVLQAQDAISSEPPSLQMLDSIVKQEQLFYQNLYPEIEFLVLKGGEDWMDEIEGLSIILGNKPVSLDYAHPYQLRQDLMYASIERIILMLNTQSPSASLFKADSPMGWADSVCVITLDPATIAKDSRQSTMHLLDLPDSTLKHITDESYLPADQYLEFVFDHEVYHCLKSYFVGPQAMSHKEFWAEYTSHQDEIGADSFALAMNIKKHHGLTKLANNITRIRGMSLFNIDADHMTCRALKDVLSMEADKIIGMQAQEIFDLANAIREKYGMSYNDYLTYLASSLAAVRMLGLGDLIPSDLTARIKDIPADNKLAIRMVENAKQCYNELTGQKYRPEDLQKLRKLIELHHVD